MTDITAHKPIGDVARFGGTARRSPIVVDALVSFFACSLVLLGFLITNPATQHWFVIPLLACGTIIGTDTVQVIRGRISIFDPIGLAGVVGIHFFFLAPLLHVHWARWMWNIDTSSIDWRHWLGRMAILNLLGIIGYMFARTLATRWRVHNLGKVAWRLNERTFRNWTLVLLFLTGLLQLFIYSRFGGVLGYINSYEDRDGDFANFGIIFSIAESFPILAMMAFVVWAKGNDRRKSWVFLGCVLLVYLLITLLFGGLRGSRGNTIWALFWAMGLIHFWVKPVPRNILLAGAVFVFGFMYLYGFYKALGTDVFTIANTQGGITAVEEESGRSMESVLLGDLARSDVQAFLLYKLSPTPEGIDYDFAGGRSYIGGISLLIPRWVWPDRPPTKATYGTDALYGSGAHESSSQLSSRAYGLAGEGMLNFGAVAVPILYTLYGCVVGVAQRWRNKLSPSDSRLLLAPFVTICAFYLLVWDSDNVTFFLFKRGALPVAVILASSFIIRRNQTTLGSNQ